MKKKIAVVLCAVGAALSLVLMVMVLVCIAVMNRFSDEEEVATI